MIRRCFVTLAAISLVIAVSTTCSAGLLLPKYVTFDGPTHLDTLFNSPYTGGGEDELNDESRSAFVDGDANQVFSQGDIIYGWIRIGYAAASGKAGVNVVEQINLAFSATLDTVSAGVWSLKATAQASAYSLPTLLDDSVQGGNADGATVWDEAIFVVVSNPSTDTANDNPVNMAPAASFAAVTSANGWSYEAIGGLAAGTADFFEFKVPPGTTGNVGDEKGGFSILDDAYTGTTFLLTDVQHFDGTITNHDATLIGGRVDPTTDNGWNFRDTSDFTVNMVPEPASLAAWGLLLGLGLFVRRRIK